jgi:predicted nucleic acid-binding protein
MALVSCLVDTNVLLRVASRSGAEHPIVDRALAHLAEQGTILHYTLQNMAEFWNVMTRPKARNGFEFSMVEAEREIRAIESGMTLLPDNAAVYARWRKIIVQ